MGRQEGLGPHLCPAYGTASPPPPPAEGRYLHQVYKPQQPLLGRVDGQNAKRKIHEMNVRGSRGFNIAATSPPPTHLLRGTAGSSEEAERPCCSGEPTLSFSGVSRGQQLGAGLVPAFPVTDGKAGWTGAVCPRSHLLRTGSDSGGICLETLILQPGSPGTCCRLRTAPQILPGGSPWEQARGRGSSPQPSAFQSTYRPSEHISKGVAQAGRATGSGKASSAPRAVAAFHGLQYSSWA